MFLGGGGVIEARGDRYSYQLPLALVSLIHASSICNMATLARDILFIFIAVLYLLFVKVS